MLSRDDVLLLLAFGRATARFLVDWWMMDGPDLIGVPVDSWFFNKYSCAKRSCLLMQKSQRNFNKQSMKKWKDFIVSV